MSKSIKINFPITLTAADSRKRTISGTIVSWAEKGITSAGATVFEKGSIDFSKPIKLLLEHDRTRPIGKMIDITADDKGIEATFRIAGTIAGDDSLLEAQEGLRDGFSVGVIVDDYDANKGVMTVKASRLMEVSLVAEPAINSARVSEVAASEQLQNSEATAEEQTKTQEDKVSETTQAPIATEAVEATKSEPVAIQATHPVAYTKPRSPIKTQGNYLEHSLRAKLGNTDSATYVMHADAEAQKTLNFADDSFSTNPAFARTQYVSTVVDTSIGSRAAIDAIGTRRLGNIGMLVQVPKITTSSSSAETGEGNAPSETGIISSYVDLTVKKYAGLQRVSVELLDRSLDPSFFDAMLENMRRSYAGATEAAVIAALTASGTQATATAADVDGIISFVKTETPAAYLATGELATRYIAGTSQWGLLIGAQDTTKRPIFSAANPQNAAGSATSQSLRGNVMGLDLYVSNKAVSTSIDESAFIVVPSSVAIYETPSLQLTNNVLISGEIETMLYGYLACGVLVAGGVRRFNLT
jgi:HK97 family phage prohead protease